MPTRSKKQKQNLHPPLVVDLCCGLGGISVAAGQLGMKVLAGVDVDASAARTYEHNFPGATTMVGSVRSGNLVERCKDLLEGERQSFQKSIVVSGPPCQGFSVAGPRDPNDPRNQILVAVARFIAAIQPHCGIIENVARVLDDNHSSRLKKLYRVFSDGGYHVHQVILNAADFGVPQNRRRAFFMVTKRRITSENLMQLFESQKQIPINVSDAIDDLPVPVPRPDKYVDAEDCGSLSNHFAMQHSKSVQAKIAAIPQGSGPMSYRKLHPDRRSNTLISGHRAPPAHYSQPRSITVREALRLQGFPDEFRVFGPFGSQMGQVTNAVPPPLARVALEVLCEVAGVDLE